MKLAPWLYVLAFGACVAAVTVPDNLQPAAGETLVAAVAAKGVQIYECRASKTDPAAYEWVFVAPEAQLFDERGALVGTHGAGPFWQANDGSKVVGTVKARADAPGGNAIPWLLLATKPEGPPGSWSKVTSVQRVNTAGGVAPTGGCGRDNAGTTARVPYTADYRLFAAK